MLDAALSWLERGAELLPCQPASKRLVAGFGPYLQRITSADDARAWFEARRCNLALVCGERFTVLDFDAAPQYAAWAELHPEAAASYTERTRRGFHVFFEGDSLSYNTPAWELKGRSGAVVLAPSVVAGFTYSVERAAPLSPLPVGLSRLSEKRSESEVVERRAPGGEGGGDVLSRVKAAWSVVELAQSVTQLHSRGGRWWRGRCPFAEHGSNERLPLWVDSERNLWGCYACGVHGDVVNLYAAIHRVSVAAAISAMAAAL